MLRVTQLAIEALNKPTSANIRVTQEAVEIIGKPTTAKMHVSQMALEVIRRSVDETPKTTTAQTIVIVVAC